MTCRLIEISPTFYNIRGSFKIGGLIDIGTHASLVKLGSGKFVFLDAYSLSEDVAAQVDQLTNDGKDIEAILNLHPFHTVHVEAMHKQYPQAKLYGTVRHHEKFPHLPWQKALAEAPEMRALYAGELDFSVPAGVDFVSPNPKLHFASVLAYHLDSKTLHADDTLMALRLPLPMRLLGQRYAVSFHPTLAKTLQRRAGAADDFRQWARQIIDSWSGAKNLCTAHTTALLESDNNGPTIADRIDLALAKVEGTLVNHSKRWQKPN